MINLREILNPPIPSSDFTQTLSTLTPEQQTVISASLVEVGDEDVARLLQAITKPSELLQPTSLIFNAQFPHIALKALYQGSLSAFEFATLMGSLG